MKKLLLLLTIAVLASSCETVRIPYKEITYAFDYSKYTKEGFFITESNSVNFDYDPIASVGSFVSTGHGAAGITSPLPEPIKKSKIKEDSVYGTKSKSKTEKQSPFKIYASASGALDALVKEAKKLGGNAIINVNITHSGSEYFPEYSATGMAVKRK